MRLGLEEEQEEETLRMPSSCSSSLYSLLFRLAQETTHSMVSIDSLQLYPQPRCCRTQEEEQEQEERSPLQRLTRLFFSATPSSQQNSVMLLELFHRFLYRLVLASLSLSYQQVVNVVTATTRRQQQQQEEEGVHSTSTPMAHDDEILQLVVDLQVCQRLSEQVGGPTDSFQALEEEVRQCLDPVLAEVTAQPLQQIANDATRRSHLLLFPSLLGRGSSGNHYAATTSSEKRGTTSDTTLDLYPASSSSSSRFGLLPLALMTTSSSAASHAATLASSSSISTKTAPPPTTSSLSTRSTGNSGGGSSGGSSSGGGIMGWFSSKG